MALLGVPDGASCTLAGEEIDCRLGNVVAPTTVHLTGRGVVANVSWRRPGSSVVYLIFARAEVEGGG